MKKIGIDARMYGSAFTGIGKHTERLLENIAILISEGKIVNVEFVIFCEPKNVEIIEALSPQFKAVGVNIPHYSFAEQFKYPLVLNHAKLDLMHFPHFNAPLLYRGKSIATIHDLILSFYPGKSKFGWIKERAYKITLGNIVKHAKKIITVSDYTKKDLIELINAHEDKITTIYNGCDEEFFEKSSAEDIQKTQEEFGTGNNYIAYIGLQREHKNIGRLIRAMQPLINTGFTGKLVLIGKEDTRYSEPRETVRELGLQKHVIFTGHMPYHQVRHLLQGAKIFCLPSLYEGFGIPVLEAMAGGIPVACSKTTSLPEVGGTAVKYFHPMRVDEISTALYDILEDTELREKMIQDGLEQARKFSWKKMAEETIELYKSLIDYNPTLTNESIKVEITSVNEVESTDVFEDAKVIPTKKKSSENEISGEETSNTPKKKKGNAKKGGINTLKTSETPETSPEQKNGNSDGVDIKNIETAHGDSFSREMKGEQGEVPEITLDSTQKKDEDPEVITIESIVEIK